MTTSKTFLLRCKKILLIRYIIFSYSHYYSVYFILKAHLSLDHEPARLMAAMTGDCGSRVSLNSHLFKFFQGCITLLRSTSDVL